MLDGGRTDRRSNERHGGTPQVGTDEQPAALEAIDPDAGENVDQEYQRRFGRELLPR